jgi:nicotinamidase-related amidase
MVASSAQETYQRQGWGLRMGFGERPALLIVDMQNDFVDESGPSNAASSARQAIPHIQRLREVCRELAVPVFYSKGIVDRRRVDEGLWQLKSAAHRDGRVQIEGTWGAEICEALTPGPDEYVITKHKPSVFFGTDFEVYLRGLKIDTLILAGSSLSGCVRATATDAFMREIRPILAIECLVDRDQAVFDANLFDLDSKYADAMPVEDIERELRRIVAAAATGG